MLNINEQDAYEIAVEGYQYFYPLITMDVTRRLMTNVPPGAKDGFGPAGIWSHMRTYPTADFREVVRPNFDTLYSAAWLDLRKEPAVISIPDSQGRYYLLPLLDMWSDVFAVPGKRTSGTQAQTYAVVPPGWSGTLPADVERIDAPTRYVWIIVRTQTNGPKDYENVHKFQDGMKLSPLSQWGKESAATAFSGDPTVDMKTPPLNQVNNMKAAQYFGYGTDLLTLHGPHITDWSMIARLRRIGIVAGQKFELSALSPALQAALERGASDGLKKMVAKLPTLAAVRNGWQMNTDTMGVYGNYYLKRAVVAMVGLGANQVQDAVYPLHLTDADGQTPDGAGRYVLHFTKEEIPPVGAFWSVTMYDNEGFQVANPLNRFAIGDRDELKYNADGSLDLYIQHENPGRDLESNWLPSAATGVVSLCMRLYAPKSSALTGEWVPPVLKKAKSSDVRSAAAGPATK